MKGLAPDPRPQTPDPRPQTPDPRPQVRPSAAQVLPGARGLEPGVFDTLRKISHRRDHGLSTALVTGNWLLYIWAVDARHVLEASLGHFENPLFNTPLSVLFLRERLRRTQAAALALATLGTSAFVVRLGTS